MGRRPCCSKEGLNRGAWTAIEDQMLTDYIRIHGEGGWRNLPDKAGLKRCGKSCRLRWLNYLRPDIKRGNITHDEEELMIRLHKLLGNRWSLIAGRIPGRTDNEIKNYWNTYLGKKVQGHQPSSTLARKQSNQSKEKNKKKRSMPRPSFEAPPPPEKESCVVRTKANRCTKVFFTTQANQVEHLNTEAAVASSTIGDFVSHKENESESYEGFPPREDNSWDFMIDHNEKGLFPSDLIVSDFLELCHFDNGIVGEGNDNNNSELSPSSEQPPVYKEEIQEDWTGSDSVHRDAVSDLRALASFLDAEEDWLGELSRQIIS